MRANYVPAKGAWRLGAGLAVLALPLALGLALGLARLSASGAANQNDPPGPPAKVIEKSVGAKAVVFAPPAVPHPVPATRAGLPAVFNKAAPTSIADLRAIQDRVEALVAKVSGAVVAVEVGYGSGSGVVISSDGLVLTAGHVSGRPNREATFTFPDGKTARGKTLGVDHDTDTGLMRITDPGSWPHVPLGDLKYARIGDWTLALGHPGGFDLNRSLVVRLGRIIQLAPNLLQTDCTISPGDSGGPLFDMHGRVIAIHSAISSSLAENFHVPITEFYETWTQLAGAEGKDSRPGKPRAYVGASAVDDAAGCRLTAIETNGPASRAGLKEGDVVVEVEGRKIMVSAAFWRWVAEAQPGEILSLEVKRGDKLLTFDLKLESDRGASAVHSGPNSNTK